MTHSRSTTRQRPALQAWALEPRMMFDAAAVATAEAVVAATDTTPGVTASGADATLTINENSGAQSVDLFSGVSVTLDNSSEALNSLSITVSSSGSNQALVVDGTTIALTVGSGETANNNYYYQVTISGGKTTLTLSLSSSDANSTADVAALIDGMAYSAQDKTVESGTVTVTLSTLSDDSDSVDLDIHATITISSDINVAPVLSDDRALDSAESFSLSDLGSDVEVAYSSDGDYAYVAGDGAMSVYSVDSSGRLSLLKTLDVDDMGTATEMVVSEDGGSIYVIDGGSNLYAFRVDSEGNLTYQGTVASENGDVTGGLAISADGSYVYAGTQYNDVVIFSRDTTTGALTALAQRAPGEYGSNSRHGTIITVGNYVYVIYSGAAHPVFVYQRNDDGTLSTAATLLTSTTGYGAVDYSLAVSADGQYLYIANPDNGSVAIYQFSGSALTLMETVALSNVATIALSEDGNLLYATTSDGVINVYAVASSGSLSLISSVTTGTSNTGDIAVSSDGLSILVASSGTITRYTLAQTMEQGAATAFAAGITLRDSNNDALASGEGNFNGSSIVVSANTEGGSFAFTDGNGLTYSNGVISLNGSTIGTLKVTDGVLTVAFTADVSSAVANQVLQQLTYANASAALGSYIVLSVTASDGALTSSALTITLRVNATPLLDTAVATGYSLTTATSETAYSFTLFSGLFSDADGDSLTWSVSGLPDGLTFDAATRTIAGSTTETGTFTVTITVTDASGASASLTLALTVEQIVNRAPEVNQDAASTVASATENTAYSTTLDSSLFSDADAVYGDTLTWSVSGLPDGLRFDATTHTITGTASALGNYTLTVTVTDASGKTASTELTLRVISVAEANNSAPVVDADDSALVYTAEGNLTGFNQYVYSLELSADDSTLIVVGNNTNSHAVTPAGNSTLYVYTRNAQTGELTLVQTFVQGTQNDGDDSNGIEVNGLDSATAAVYSVDGQYVYLVGKNSDGTYVVSVLSVNEDGTLSVTGLSTTIADAAQIKQMVVSDDGESLYIISSNTLYAYTLGDNGALTLAGSYSDSYSTASALAVDSSGHVYVLGGSKLIVYTANEDGTLTYATTGTGIGLSSFSRSIVVSDSGYIYVATGTGNTVVTLHYDSDSNSVTKVASVSAAQVWGLSLSADGTALYVGYLTGAIYVYTVNDNGSLTQTGTLSGSGGRGFRYAISSDGSSIYAGGFYNGTGLGQISTSGVAAAYTEGGTTRITSALTLSDTDYDAMNDGVGNYNGATITVARDGGANSDDSYGFADGNGLTYSDGVISLNGSAIATLVSDNGTLTITFTAEVTSATANAVLQQITYSNASQDPGSSISLRVAVGDQYTAGSITVLLTVTEVNDAPTLSSSTIAATFVTGASGVHLFDDTEISATEDSQAISALTMTVSGISDGSNETLTLDGTAIALVAGSGTTRSGYSYTVTVTGDTATVTLTSSSGIAVSNAATLVDAITYSNASTTPSGETRTVTLTAIKDNGGTSNGGVDSTALSIAATITLSDHNSAPTLTSNGNNGSYTENGNGSTLFSGTQVSTGESGQSILSLTLTVTGVQDGSNETLTLDGTSIALVEGSGTTSSGYRYSVTVTGEGVAVTLTSSSGMAAVSAAALVDSITYADTGDDPTAGVRTVTLSSIQDNGGSANTGSDTTLLSIATTITVIAVNDAPVLTGNVVNSTYTVTGTSTGLFSGTVVSAVESGQTINDVLLTIAGVVDGRSETLVIDGTTVLLIDGSGTTASGYHYNVSVDADTGVVTVTLSSSTGIAQVATVIDAITYANQSNTFTAGERSVSLSVRDSGGSANNGSDTTSLATAAVVTLVDNDAPVIGSSPDNETLTLVESLSAITGLSDIAASTLSDDGNYLYVVSSDGAIAIFTRNASSGELVYLATVASGLGDISDIQIGADGNQLYVLGDGGDAIAIYQRTSSDGSLTRVQTLVTEHLVSFSVATDGSAIYAVDGNYSGLLVYTLNSSSGEFSLTQRIAAAASSAPYLFTGVSIATVGDYVYVLTNPVSSTLADSLIVYQRGSDGTLSAVAYVRDGSGASFTDPQSMAVSSDGSTVYIATSNGVSVVHFDAAGTTLTAVATLEGVTSIRALALASDDDSLYIQLSDGTVNRYDVSGATITLLQTLASANVSDAQGITVASNGAIVAIGSNALLNLQEGLSPRLSLTYNERDTRVVAGNLTLSDSDYDALNNGSGNYNGATITITRSGEANSSDSYGIVANSDLTLSAGILYYQGTAIATFTSTDGTLTLTFTADVATAVANQVLQGLTYTNSSIDPGTSITLVLTVSDGYQASDSVELVLAVTEINDAPTLNTTPHDVDYQAGQDAVPVFSGSALSTLEAGQSIVALRVTVSGVIDQGETVRVDGAAVALLDGTRVTTEHGLAVTVVVENGTATLVITSAGGLSTEAAAALVDGLAYANNGEQVTTGERILTLIAVQDNGGTAAGGVDTASLAIAATVTVANSAPQATDSDVILPGATQAEQYSTTLPATLFTDVNGDTLHWQVTGLPSGLSFDAATLTISGKTLAFGNLVLTVTVSDGQGGSATRTLMLSIDKQPVSPTFLPAATAVNMMEQWLHEQDEKWREDPPLSPSRPLPVAPGAVARVALPTTMQQADSLARDNYPLVGGALNYAATPWQLDPVVPVLMPNLDRVDFSALRSMAPTPVPRLSALAAEGDVTAKAAFSQQVQQQQGAADAFLLALAELAALENTDAAAS